MSSNLSKPPSAPEESRDSRTRVFPRRDDRQTANEIPADVDRADLVSLLRSELRQSWMNGDSVWVEQFRTQLDRAGADADDWLSLIAAELGLRRERGQFPELEEYVRRFPNLAPRLPRTYQDAISQDDDALTHLEEGSQRESLFDGSFAGKTMRQKVSSDELRIEDLGLKLPGYEILSVLGRGGMGVVYQARQIGLNRIVALKMILSGCHADEEDRARFLLEAEAVAALHHPHIVQVFEIGEHEGRPFFSMEYVAGGTLGQHINGQPQSPAFAAEMAEQLALAVHAAHRQSIIHRDLKPANILLTTNGSETAEADTATHPDEKTAAATATTGSPLPKITDFGLAKRLDCDLQITTSGFVAGTPQYMAPEQISASRQDQVGPAADIWSLGVILYEMLTGRPPFLGSNPAEIMHQVLRQEPVGIRQLQPHVPRDLETICLKCLQKEHHKRYPSAEALADDLRRFRSGDAILARPVGVFEQIWRWRKRNPSVAALIALVVVMLVCGVVIASSFAVAAREEARRAEHHAQEADRFGAQANQSADALRIEKKTVVEAHQKLSDTFAELKKAHEQVSAARQEEERLKQEAEQREHLRARELYDAQMTLAQRAWELGLVPRTRHLLAAYEPLHHDREDLRGFEWFYLDRISNADGLRFKIPDGCRSVAVSPDGNRIIWAFRTVCEVWQLDTPPKRLFAIGVNPADAHRGIVERVAYDPAGKFIATASRDRTVKIWEAESGKLLHTLTTGDRWALGIRFSPDGKSLAAAIGSEQVFQERGETRVWDTASGELRFAVAGHEGAIYDVAWSPDNDCFATAGHDSFVRVWDARDGTEIRKLKLQVGVVARSVAFAPKGALVAAGTARGEIVVWSRDDWKEQRILRGHMNWVLAVAFRSDGRSLVSAGTDMLLKLWDAGNGMEIRTYRGHSSVVMGAAWHPKLPFVFSASLDQSIRGWDALQDPEQFPIRSRIGNLAGFHLLPDGKHLAIAGNKAFAAIWDSTQANSVRTVDMRGLPLGDIHGSALSPDGSTMAFARCPANDDGMGAIFAWSFGQPEPLPLKLPDLHAGVRSVAYSPDGKFLATGHRGGTVQVHDLSGLAAPRSWEAHGNSIHQVHFVPGPDRRLLTVSGDQTPRLWNADAGAEIRRFQGHDGAIRGAAFSNDGKLLATTSTDQSARVWEVASGQLLFRLYGHIAAVTCAAFSPNADRLVTGSDDFTLKLWDLRTGLETLTLRGHTFRLIQVAFAPDGRRILSSALDETVRVWSAGPVGDREVLRAAAAACRLTGFTIEGQPQAGGKIEANLELSNVSGIEWPTPPPRKTDVPYRTVMRVFAEPLEKKPNDPRPPFLIGLYELLPTSGIAIDYKHTARIQLSLQMLEPGQYRLRVDHGWQGDKVVRISEQVLDVEVVAKPKEFQPVNERIPRPREKNR